jgi:hypothetical protein
VITLDDDGGVSPYDNTCLIDEQHGVFVDGSRGDDTSGDGSREFPLRTLQAGVGTALGSGKRVYACVGKYQGPLAIGTSASDGLGVYGGLSCETFQPDTSGARTQVEVMSGGPALIIADTSDIEVERIDFSSMTTDHPPGTTYLAASIGNSHRISLVDVALRAAAGEAGADGAAPAATPKQGATGISGADACAGNPNSGASPVVNAACTMQSTVGGAGGDGATGTANGGNGGFGAGGQGGLGEMTGTNWSCSAGTGLGQPGYMGYDGGPGNGAKGFGALVGGRFTGFSGQAGGAGGAGYGGAGGGGAKAPSSCSALATATGASGGGGGAGGCGGKGGKGGSAGGSSIALVLVDSTSVRLMGGSIAYGDGGKGGNGADGQAGGKGGLGGPGGKGSGGAHDACGGTAGGDGGKGGPGGGANGGHAIGVLYLGKPPTLSGVMGQKEAAMRKGGMPGQGPASITDMNMVMQMTGTAGVAEFLHAM